MTTPASRRKRVDIFGHWHDSSFVLKGFGSRTLLIPIGI